MPLTEARKRANKKYDAKTYEHLNIRLKKGKREEYKKKAEAEGLSLAQYVVNALEYYENRNN